MSERDAPAVTIRAATVEDDGVLSMLAARLTEFELPEWRTPDEIATADGREMMASVRRADPDDEVLIAERDGVVVGCLHLLALADFFGRRHGHISVIATTKAAEGTGVGRVLIAHAEAWTRRRGLGLLTLNVFETNARARRFYERVGFVPEFVKYTKPVSGSES